MTDIWPSDEDEATVESGENLDLQEEISKEVATIRLTPLSKQ